VAGYSIQRASYCSLLKPKIPKYREPNKRNAKGSSITINFHPRWDEETYFKAKNCSKFRRCASLHDRMFKLILHANMEAWVFVDRFCSHFNARGFINRSKSLIQLRSNNVHYHFCFWSPQSRFKPAICRRNLLESTPIFTFSRRL